jgi:RimJ/RimL family protein N-acetyltransferase
VDTAADLDRLRPFADATLAWEGALALVGKPPPDDDLGLRAAMPEDRDVVRALRNEPEAVRWSGTGRAVSAAEHKEWFETRLVDPSSRLWVARQTARTVGQVRVDVRDGVGTVSIVVAAGDRGRGLGRRMLHLLDTALRADEQVHTLTAEVHPDNVASRRLFERAGFSSAPEPDRLLRYRRVRRPAGR